MSVKLGVEAEKSAALLKTAGSTPVIIIELLEHLILTYHAERAQHFRVFRMRFADTVK